MSTAREETWERRVQSALEELRRIIVERYPSARFDVTRDPEEPENIDLLAEIDVEDPDEVLESVLDRLIELQVDERIPVHVIPVRTPERILAELQDRPGPTRRSLRKVSSTRH